MFSGYQSLGVQVCENGTHVSRKHSNARHETLKKTWLFSTKLQSRAFFFEARFQHTSIKQTWRKYVFWLKKSIAPPLPPPKPEGSYEQEHLSIVRGKILANMEKKTTSHCG